MCDSFCNNSIPTSITGDRARYATEICQKESSGSEQRLVFSKFDAAELEPLFTPGTFLDAFFSLDPYDYQQHAGIRLVAKKLIIHSNWWEKKESLIYLGGSGVISCEYV
jgi:hypothetical protein